MNSNKKNNFMSELEESDLQLINDILGIDNDNSDPIFTNPTKPTIQSNNLTTSNSYQPTNVQASKEDDDFLWSTSSESLSDSHSPRETLPSKPKSSSNYTENTQITGNQSHSVKCTGIFVGGTDLPEGITTSSSDPHFCSSLICISCDMKVSRYFNKRWKPGTDYLFLRNNYPETVSQNLIHAKGWCAYCCQCTFCEEEKTRRLPSFSSNWVCRGHKIEVPF